MKIIIYMSNHYIDRTETGILDSSPVLMPGDLRCPAMGTATGFLLHPGKEGIINAFKRFQMLR